MTDTRRRHLTATALSASCSVLTAGVVEAADFLDDPAPSHFFLAIFLFALFGGVGRLLFLWDAETRWQRQAGSLILAVFGAFLVGLYFWDTLKPPVLLAACGAMAAAGGEVVERLARTMAERTMGRR